MPDSYLRKKAVIASIIVLIIIFMGIFLFMASEGNHSPSTTATTTQNASGQKPAMGTLDAVCGGRDRLPCMPGLLCSTAPGQFANTMGVCVKDNTPQPKVVNEGEACDDVNTVCQPGFTCEKSGNNGACVNILGESKKAFIFSLIPIGAELDNGVYKAPAGTKLHITVEAVNVKDGGLYYLPESSNKIGPDETNKVAPLIAVKDKPNSYEADFDVQKDTLGQLFAKMQGTDGQPVSIPVTVGAK